MRNLNTVLATFALSYLFLYVNEFIFLVNLKTFENTLNQFGNCWNNCNNLFTSLKFICL